MDLQERLWEVMECSLILKSALKITVSSTSEIKSTCLCNFIKPSLVASTSQEYALTRNTDMTAASIELLTGTGATLLLRSRIDMDVIWSVLQVLGKHCKSRAIILLNSKDSSLSPVGPEDVLLEDSHGVRVLDSMQDYLSVLTSQSRPLDLISGRKYKSCQKIWTV